jgi:hypothetical protein
MLTGVVLSPRGPEGVRALYEHIAGRRVSLEEVRVGSGPYRAYLLDLFPELSTFSVIEVPHREFAEEWVERRAREFSGFFEVPPPPEDHPLRRGTGVKPPPGPTAAFYEWPTSSLPYIIHPSNAPVVTSRPMLPTPEL